MMLGRALAQLQPGEGVAGAFSQRGDEHADGLVVDGGVNLAQVEVQLDGAVREEHVQQVVTSGKKNEFDRTE